MDNFIAMHWIRNESELVVASLEMCLKSVTHRKYKYNILEIENRSKLCKTTDLLTLNWGNWWVSPKLNIDFQDCKRLMRAKMD